MPATEKQELEGAETKLRAALEHLKRAANLVGKDEPVLIGNTHIGKLYFAKMATPPDGDLSRRRADVALMQDEAADLCGRVAALIAQIG
jgi:hypothetical protein